MTNQPTNAADPETEAFIHAETEAGEQADADYAYDRRRATADIYARNAEIERLLGDNLGCFNSDGSDIWQENESGNLDTRLNICLMAIEARVDRAGHSYLLNGNWHVTNYGLFKREEMWLNREGQPWQADLEVHVANWRAIPRDFASDIDLCMKVLWPRIKTRMVRQMVGMYCEVRLVEVEAEDCNLSSGWIVEANDLPPLDDPIELLRTPFCTTAGLAICNAFVATFEGEVVDGQ